MLRECARSPVGSLEGAGWYGGDPWNVTNRSNARYPVSNLFPFQSEELVVSGSFHCNVPRFAYSHRRICHRQPRLASAGNHMQIRSPLAPTAGSEDNRHR